MSNVIKIKELSKSYKVHTKEPGLVGSLKGLVNRQYKEVKAVKNINLSIEEGELVGFIGPNGAGKTTTLKMLSGLLYPSSGEATVLGFTPWQRKKDYLKQMSLVMGQKAQLWWDLPLYDSLLLQRDIYEMDYSDFDQSLEELTGLLELEDFLKVQVRKLSLGQRMRGELAAALIYHPKILFLDEPTIGLDVIVQKKVRQFIKEYQQKYQATIILTSHYLDDVRELASRLVLINHGQIAYDGTADDLINKHADYKRVVLTFTKNISRGDLEPYGRITKHEPLRTAIQVPREETTKRAAEILTKFPVEDVSIEEPKLESVIRHLFSDSHPD